MGRASFMPFKTLDLIENWWRSTVFQEISSFVVTENLKVLKQKLKCWNKEEFDSMEERKLAIKNMADWMP